MLNVPLLLGQCFQIGTNDLLDIARMVNGPTPWSLILGRF